MLSNRIVTRVPAGGISAEIVASAWGMHRSQMPTPPGPVISAFVCFWSRPQNEQHASCYGAVRRLRQRRLPPADSTI